jgi:cullin 4
MFNDIYLSKDTIDEFKKTAMSKEIVEAGVEFTVETLTNGHWPDQQQEACVLPPELKDITTKFETFYKQKHSRRNLIWLMHHGTVELKPVFSNDKNYIFSMTTYQSIICLLFNSNEDITFQKIKDLTRIPPAQLQTALMWLCNPK